MLIDNLDIFFLLSGVAEKSEKNHKRYARGEGKRWRELKGDMILEEILSISRFFSSLRVEFKFGGSGNFPCDIFSTQKKLVLQV